MELINSFWWDSLDLDVQVVQYLSKLGTLKELPRNFLPSSPFEASPISNVILPSRMMARAMVSERPPVRLRCEIGCLHRDILSSCWDPGYPSRKHQRTKCPLMASPSPQVSPSS